jgi:type VI secretion system lysozyme-like protein
MNLPKVQDRLQPALLDRLRDDDPLHTTEPAESRVLSRARLREAVLRDLSWLFNTAQLGSSEPMDDYPEARRSVLNYGLPVISGQTISSIDPVALEGQVRRAIIDNEPRILPDTLHVEAMLSDDRVNHHNQLSFRISGQLWAQPVPLELMLHTDIDLETGRVDVRELPAESHRLPTPSRPYPMDPRLLRYYNQELQHLREMGAEFAQAFPKIAARLRMDGIEVGDPYVERLLEGFAFLASRVQLKLDAEFPRFTERLLEIVYPNYLSPTPSMMVAQVQPILGDAALAAGVKVPRGSELRSGAAAWHAHRMPLPHRARPAAVAAGDRVGVVLHARGQPARGPRARMAQVRWRPAHPAARHRRAGLRKIALSDLRLYCSANDDVAYRLHELICGHTLGALVLPVEGSAAPQVLSGDCVRAVGFDDEHALLPVTLTGFAGYRLLQEYFAFPQRFLFFDLAAGSGAACHGRQGG